MKELIKNHIRGIKGFAEDYGIPYNTVCQWANGSRKPPEWITKLFYSIRDKNGIEQIEIKNENIKYQIGIKSKYGYSEYTCNTVEELTFIELSAKAEKNEISFKRKIQIIKEI